MAGGGSCDPGADRLSRSFVRLVDRAEGAQDEGDQVWCTVLEQAYAKDKCDVLVGLWGGWSVLCMA